MPSCASCKYYAKLKLKGRATPNPDRSTPAPTTSAMVLAIVASLEFTASDALLETAPASTTLFSQLA